MHIVDPQKGAGLWCLLSMLTFGFPGLIADLMTQKCAICGYPLVDWGVPAMQR